MLPITKDGVFESAFALCAKRGASADAGTCRGGDNISSVRQLIAKWHMLASNGIGLLSESYGDRICCTSVPQMSAPPEEPWEGNVYCTRFFSLRS